jgi:hypothetical protein
MGIHRRQRLSSGLTCRSFASLGLHWQSRREAPGAKSPHFARFYPPKPHPLPPICNSCYSPASACNPHRMNTMGASLTRFPRSKKAHFYPIFGPFCPFFGQKTAFLPQFATPVSGQRRSVILARRLRRRLWAIPEFCSRKNSALAQVRIEAVTVHGLDSDSSVRPYARFPYPARVHPPSRADPSEREFR